MELGERAGLPIISNVDAACAKILPDGCYALEDDVFEKTNIFDCVFAVVSARLIALAYDDLSAAMAFGATIMPAGTVFFAFPQPTPYIPAGVVAAIGDTVIVWLTGTTTFQQAALQAFYFGLGPVDQGLYSSSQANENGALAVADFLNAHGFGVAERIVLIGHSFGGAICMTLAARMLTAMPNRNVEILTYGAPAPGDDRLHDLIATLAQRHYWNASDPIPYMPPQGLNFAIFVPFVGPLLAILWAGFERPPFVRVIATDGTVTAADSREFPEDLLSITALAIASNNDVPAFKDHRIEWYAYYLCLGCRCIARPCPMPDGGLLGFDFILQGLRWMHFGVVVDENYAKNLTFDPLPTSWFANEGIDQRVLITVTFDAVGNYDVFTVRYYHSEDGVIIARFEWQFPAAEMVMGIDTTTTPTLFSFGPDDFIVSPGRLVIPSSFLFPPIDGMGGIGWIPIFDGDGLP